MSDEKRVIAQDGSQYRVTSGGNLQIFSGNGWKRFEYMLPDRIWATLLADAVRRAREERPTLGEVLELVTKISEMNMRIEAVREETVSGHNHLSDRLAAVEREVTSVDSNSRISADRVADLESDVAALRQDSAPSGDKSCPCGKPGFHFVCDIPEARQQDEAGEGADPEDQVITLSVRDLKKEHEGVRREMAREIADEIRTRNWPAVAPGLAISNWIEREFGGAGIEKESNTLEIETGDGWAVHRHIADAIRSELAQKIVDWLRNRYTYDDAYGPSEKAKHASGVVMGAAAQIEREYCK